MSTLRAETEEKRDANETASSDDATTKSEVSPKISKKIIKQSRERELSLSDDERASKIPKYDTDKTTDVGAGSSSYQITSGGSKKDNDAPEATKTIDNTILVAEHYNALEEKGLSQRNQSRIVYMRNFNNWIKSMLINEYLSKVKKANGIPLRVLDMCCGKGGDLLKWKKGNITHLICTDIAQVSLEQCQQRYDDMKNKSNNSTFFAEFITADCTKVRLREKFKDPSLQLDFVSCQFAFHYSFESLPQAECMLRNAGESLRPGGYFIGTIPDAYDLVSRWQKCDDNKFGNDVYNIEFLCEDKTQPPLFGAKYNFHLEGVVDCPEFLVHLPTLSKLALKHGLQLVMFERFEKFYERFANEGRSLLTNMQALESYSPESTASLLGDPKRDYQHAINHTKNLPHNTIGTLSQSEWEVTSLYAVFAFRKLKTIWSSEGKAAYVQP